MTILSWKSYGGINNFEKSNNVSVNNLSADYFTLKNAYLGYFSIQGQLSVTQDTHLNSNVTIGGNSIIEFNNHIYGNVLINKNIMIDKNLGVGGDVDISGNSLMRGNLHLMQNFELEKNLKVNGNLIQLDKNNSLYNINLYALNKTLGFNNQNPIYTLDLNADQEKGFSIKSKKWSNTNIIAQNSQAHGINVSVNDNYSGINFFNDTSITDNTDLRGDCSITYKNGGELEIGNCRNILLHSNVSIGKKTGPHTLLNESVVIYDISSGPFLPNIFEDSCFNSGSAITLVADNQKSNTSLNIITPSGSGISIVGGSYINDISFSSGSIGVFNNNNEFVTSQTFIANNNLSNRTTIGINTTLPETNNYVLDINGTTKISHNEILLTNSYNWNIKKNCFFEKSPK